MIAVPYITYIERPSSLIKHNTASSLNVIIYYRHKSSSTKGTLHAKLDEPNHTIWLYFYPFCSFTIDSRLAKREVKTKWDNQTESNSPDVRPNLPTR